MARAGAGRAGAATSRAGRAGKGRTSGARNDTSGAAEELSRRHDRRRYAAIDRQHEPVTELGWEPLDACPGPGSGTAERLGDLLDSSPPYPLARATSLSATVSQTHDRRQHGPAAASMERSPPARTAEPVSALNTGSLAGIPGPPTRMPSKQHGSFSAALVSRHVERRQAMTFGL